jgi:tellurite resistance protein
MRDSPAFCYNADLGKLPHQDTILPDWTTVAQLRLDWLTFPRKGKRNLQFHTSILSRESGEEIACAECNFIYENIEFGYIDLQENVSRTKALAVPLAFAVSAADRKMHRREIDLIKNWVKANIDLSQASDEVMRELDKALDKTVVFFRDGNQVNIFKICKELVEIAPLAQRYDILELCLYVAQADGSAAIEELDILKSLASWLEVDADKFRTMMEKILPVSIHEVKDTEVLIGVTSGMSKEGSRHQLNREYAKWNARVTNSDPQIRAQADQMLMMIADARSQYVG